MDTAPDLCDNSGMKFNPATTFIAQLEKKVQASRLADRKQIHEAAQDIADSAFAAFVARGGRANSQQAIDVVDEAYRVAKAQLEN